MEPNDPLTGAISGLFRDTPDQAARGKDLAVRAPDDGDPLTGAISGLFRDAPKRSAEEIIQRGQFTGRGWKDTAEQLKKGGYAAPEQLGKMYEQDRVLAEEKTRQGAGVGFGEQSVRNLIPFGSAAINSRRESANAEAQKRFQEGKATPEDVRTLATYQRRTEADKAINSTTAGQLLGIPLAAPAILGETIGAGKVLGLGGKALGIGQVARAPLLAAANPTAGRAALNYAGKQALLTPLVPSMYLQAANQKNLEEGRNPNDVRGFVPALGLGYANMLVLGSLQKFGNSGSFADQIVQKGAIGVGEQALADVGAGAADEFLPKAYKMGTRYGVLGDLARGDVSKGLCHATQQMLTFSYFAALHGKQPDVQAQAYRDALAAQFKAGLGAEAAAAAVELPRKIISDELRRNPDLTQKGAKKALDEVNAALPRPMAEANTRYGYALADALPTQPRLKNIVPNGDAAAAREPVKSDPSLTTGGDDFLISPADREAFAKGEPLPSSEPLGRGWKLHLATNDPEAVSKVLKNLGLPHKLGRNASQSGKDVTVYIGSRDKANLAAKSINDAAGGLLSDPHGDAVKDGISFGGKVVGRFDARDADFHQYGGRGIPHLLEDVNPWDSPKADRYERADKKLREKYGEFYSGSAEPPVDPVATMHPEDLVQLPSMLGLNQKQFKAALADPAKGPAIRKVAEAVNTDRAERAEPKPSVERPPEPTPPGITPEAAPRAEAPPTPPPVAPAPEVAPAPTMSRRERIARLGQPPAEAPAPPNGLREVLKNADVVERQYGDRTSDDLASLDYGDRYLSLRYRPDSNLLNINFGYAEKLGSFTGGGEGGAKKHTEDLLRDLKKIIKSAGEAGLGIEYKAAPGTVNPKSGRVKGSSRQSLYEGALKEAGYELVSREEDYLSENFIWQPKGRAADVTVEDQAARAGDEGPVAESPEPISRQFTGQLLPEGASATLLPRPAPPVKAERRSAPFTPRPSSAKGGIDASLADQRDMEKVDKTPYSSVPKVYRNRIDARIPDLVTAGHTAEEIRFFARVVYYESGRAGVSALADHYDARFETVTDKIVKVAEQRAAAAQEATDGLVRELTGDTYGDEAAAAAATRLRERVEATLRESDRIADQAVNGRDAAETPLPKKPGQAPGEKVGARPKAQTVADAVRDAGGISFDAGMKRFYDSIKDAAGDSIPLSLFKKGGRSIEQLAQELEGHTGSGDPQSLIDALREGRTSRLADTTARDEFDLKAEMRQREEAGREQDAARIKSAEAEFNPNPNPEEVPFSTDPGTELLGGDPSLTTGDKGAFGIIAAQNKLFDVRNYVERAVPYNKDALAVALREQAATVTSKIAAGDPLVNLEEHAHHLQKGLGIPDSPAGLPLQVARGAQQFYNPKKPIPSRLGMVEGFAKWLRLRSTDGLTGLTPEQEVATRYFEKAAREKGLIEAFDAVRDMYRRYKAKPAAEQAAGNVSSTGKPVEADRTAGEIATTLTQKAEGLVLNDLSVLQRLTLAAKKLGHKVGIGEDPYTVYSQLMFADPARAGEFERDGVHTYVDGRKQVIGESLAKITEGANPEWLQPGANGEASKAGTYAVARHVVGEAERGRTGLVSDVQLEQYRRALAEFQGDKDFVAWADGFADRLTKGFNATRKALAGKDVHFLSPAEVEAWEKKYPDYIPTDRVQQDAGWNNLKGGRGENPKKVTGERSGSGEQIIDPLISYKNRLRVTSAVMGEQLKRIAVEKMLNLPGMGGWGVAGEAKLTDLGKERAETLKDIGFKGDELRDLLKSMGLDRGEEYFTTRPWPTDGSKPTFALKNAEGKLVNYRIGNRELYELITGQQVEANALASWLKTTSEFLPVKLMTQAVKFGATSASLGFQFRNVPRDVYTFWSNTIDRMRANPRDLGDAYKRTYAFAWHQLTGHFGGSGSADALFKRFANDRGTDLRQFAFDPAKPESAYEPNRGPTIKAAHTIWGVLKDTLNLTGAGELAPRFLEWKTRLQQTTGKGEAELNAALEAAEKAAQEGRHGPDPIPFSLALDAMNHAAEVTTNFGRLGTATREMNKITPFFGPAVAGLDKAVRNWKENPKGAAFALSGLMGARLLHWLMFSDEDWYKELNSNDRYNNFVVPTPAGLRRLPSARGPAESFGGGFLITALDAAAQKNPDLKGYLKESFLGNLPPAPVPPAAKVGYEIATNENWMGSPIVPKRDEGKATGEKWTDDRLPYAADQLTGGLLSARKVPEKPADLIPYSEVRNARRSVDEFFDRYHDLERRHLDAQRSGARFPEEPEYRRAKAIQDKIVNLGRTIRGERMVNGKVVKGQVPSEERIRELRDEQIRLAR